MIVVYASAKTTAKRALARPGMTKKKVGLNIGITNSVR